MWEVGRSVGRVKSINDQSGIDNKIGSKCMKFHEVITIKECKHSNQIDPNEENTLKPGLTNCDFFKYIRSRSREIG